MIRSAALLAAIGTLLLAAMYLVNNVIPILANLDVVAPIDGALVLYSTIVPALIWSVFFLLLWRGRDIRAIARVTAVVAVAGPMLLQLAREGPTLSPFSIDSIQFVITVLTYAAVWIWVLLLWGNRGMEAKPTGLLTLLLVLTAVRALIEVPGAVFSLLEAMGGQLATYWEAEPWQAPWRLVGVPSIRVYYWFSQVVFLLVARGGRVDPRPRGRG